MTDFDINQPEVEDGPENNSEEEDIPPEDARYRDIELEQAQAQKKADMQLAQQVMEELAGLQKQDQNVIDGVRGNTRRELTKRQVEAEVKKVEQVKLKGTRAREVQQAQKTIEKRRDEDMLTASKGAKSGLVNTVKKALNKLVAHKMHSERAPGDQAGSFDNQKDGVSTKRTLKHEFIDSRPETVKDSFSQTKDGVTISGTVSKTMESGGKGHAPHQAGNAKVEVEKASAGSVSEVSATNLGRLTSDAIRASLKGPEGMGR